MNKRTVARRIVEAFAVARQDALDAAEDMRGEWTCPERFARYVAVIRSASAYIGRDNNVVAVYTPDGYNHVVSGILDTAAVAVDPDGSLTPNAEIVSLSNNTVALTW